MSETVGKIEAIRLPQILDLLKGFDLALVYQARDLRVTGSQYIRYEYPFKTREELISLVNEAQSKCGLGLYELFYIVTLGYPKTFKFTYKEFKRDEKGQFAI